MSHRRRSISLHYTPPSLSLPPAPSDDIDGPSRVKGSITSSGSSREGSKTASTLELMENDKRDLADEEEFESEVGVRQLGRDGDTS
jgi:hypothetical protein